MMVPVKQFQIFNHDLIFHVKINKHTLLISMVNFLSPLIKGKIICTPKNCFDINFSLIISKHLICLSILYIKHHQNSWVEKLFWSRGKGLWVAFLVG